MVDEGRSDSINTAFPESQLNRRPSAGVTGPDDERRNIVFILTDDQRFDALGLLNDYFRTPNLDRLAEGGVLFENAFVTTSLCSPSRASILSGQYAHDGRTGFNRFVREYAEALMAVDDSVGRVVEALSREGLLDSTLLVFTSDNGFQFGEHGLIDKWTMYEASIRVPLIVHCPDLFEGGRRRPEMILNIDFGPTFLEAAGAPIPDTMHGRSFHGLIDGTSDDWRDTFLYEYFWERAFPQTPTVLGVRGDRYKLIRFHGVWEPYELYDLYADPLEMRNLLGDVRVETQAGTVDRQIMQRAAPEVAEIFAGLMERLNAILRETGVLDEPTWRAATSIR